MLTLSIILIWSLSEAGLYIGLFLSLSDPYFLRWREKREENASPLYEPRNYSYKHQTRSHYLQKDTLKHIHGIVEFCREVDDIFRYLLGRDWYGSNRNAMRMVRRKIYYWACLQPAGPR